MFGDSPETGCSDFGFHGLTQALKHFLRYCLKQAMITLFRFLYSSYIIHDYPTIQVGG
jgi:hypothetical protein